jgi:hypothetical protein
LCHGPATSRGRVRYLSVNLLDGSDIAQALTGVPGATHVFYLCACMSSTAAIGMASIGAPTRQTKLRRAGFHEAIDTGEMFVSQFVRYREARILP